MFHMYKLSVVLTSLLNIFDQRGTHFETKDVDCIIITAIIDCGSTTDEMQLKRWKDLTIWSIVWYR